ncbi:hypothetical protein NPX98_06270, partial [Bartonella sp. A5(2022)]
MLKKDLLLCTVASTLFFSCCNLTYALGAILRVPESVNSQDDTEYSNLLKKAQSTFEESGVSGQGGVSHVVVRKFFPVSYEEFSKNKEGYKTIIDEYNAVKNTTKAKYPQADLQDYVYYWRLKNGNSKLNNLTFENYFPYAQREYGTGFKKNLEAYFEGTGNFHLNLDPEDRDVKRLSRESKLKDGEQALKANQKRLQQEQQAVAAQRNSQEEKARNLEELKKYLTKQGENLEARSRNLEARMRVFMEQKVLDAQKKAQEQEESELAELKLTLVGNRQNLEKRQRNLEEQRILQEEMQNLEKQLRDLEGRQISDTTETAARVPSVPVNNPNNARSERVDEDLASVNNVRAGDTAALPSQDRSRGRVLLKPTETRVESTISASNSGANLVLARSGIEAGSPATSDQNHSTTNNGNTAVQAHMSSDVNLTTSESAVTTEKTFATTEDSIITSGNIAFVVRNNGDLDAKNVHAKATEIGLLSRVDAISLNGSTVTVKGARESYGIIFIPNAKNERNANVVTLSDIKISVGNGI